MNMHKKITFMTIAVCLNAPAMATDVADFGAFYNLYKTATTQNDITITSDITSTRLLSVPGAHTTNIDGGDFGFNGGGFSGFTVSRGYDFSLRNAGAFSVSGTDATITKSYNNFVQTPQGAVIANLGGNVIIENSAFENILAEASSLGQANGTQGIYEEIMQQQNFDKNNRDKIISFTTAREMTNNQLQSLEARRKRFLEARERIYSDPQKKANREKAEKIREQKRQQRIANLRSPQYVMKNIEGKDDPALTAAMRKYYQDRFLMK